jgi:hypothetical protein
LRIAPSSSSGKAHGGNAALLAAALANLDDRCDARTVEALPAEHRVARPQLTDQQLRLLPAWRLRLWEAFAAPTRPEQVGAVNRLLTDAVTCTNRPSLAIEERARMMGMRRGETRDAAHWAEQTSRLSTEPDQYVQPGEFTVRDVKQHSVCHHPDRVLQDAVEHLATSCDDDYGLVPQPDPALAGRLEGLAAAC